VVVGREAGRAAPLEQHRQVQVARVHVLGLGDGVVHAGEVAEDLAVGLQ
jgi:hypothetical protein